MYKEFRKLAMASGIALAACSGTVVAADTISQDVTEARQETQIWTTFALSPYLRAHDLKVSVDDGKATLTGKVDEDVNKDLAKQIALGVSGVTEVDNQIVVEADYVPPARAERSYGDKVDDATITAAVKSKLLWSKHTDGLTTDVDTTSGQVTLRGTADTATAKELAGRLAMNTRGVVSVDNQLVAKDQKPTVADKAKKSAQDAERTVADGWITAKVKSTFLYSRNVDGSRIKVDTTQGMVTLSGKVSGGAEHALAVELAKNIRGVKGVDSKGLTH